MQKVSKELLAAMGTGAVKYPPLKKREYDISSLVDIIELVKVKENILATELAKSMKTKMTGGKKLFDVWMLEESDMIQATSKAYGERICLEKMLEAKESDVGVQNIIKRLTALFAYHLVVQDLVFYTRKGLLSGAQTQSTLDTFSVLIKEYAPFVPDTVKSLGIEEHMIYAPIAKDWKEYNAGDNRGEVYASKL